MHQEYLDSIGLYQQYGHPYGFATMTCNSNWREIQENLKDGETSLKVWSSLWFCNNDMQFKLA